jgi:hypothetical protein
MNTTIYKGVRPMPDVYLTPTADGGVIELSKTLFRKKILPKGTIDYKGRKIVFDEAYLTDLATAYHDGAYDQVPFMLADATNAHTMDPERFRGEIKGVEVADDGLWGTFELSADAAQMVKDNPKLGVSARIVEGYGRSDGKTFPRAMQHVLGTLDPRIPGLGAWTEVALSGYDSTDEVVDLTDSTYEGEEAVAGKSSEDDLIDGLTREEYEALLATLELEDEKPEDTVEEDEDEGEEDETGAEDKQLTGAALANQSTAIELANEEIRELKRGRAHDKFEADKRDLVRRGVPPALVELARPVLEAPDGFTIDLSNGVDGEQKVDAAHIVRQLLDSASGYIALAQERGHSVDFANEDADKSDEDKDALDMWEKMFPTAGNKS